MCSFIILGGAATLTALAVLGILLAVGFTFSAAFGWGLITFVAVVVVGIVLILIFPDTLLV